MDSLRVEYIVIITKDNLFCKTIKSFQKLLEANDEIEIKPSPSRKLIYKNITFDCKISKHDLSNKGRFFNLNVTCNQVNQINEFEILLKTIRSIIFSINGEIKVLWDDISFYYSKLAYPLIYEIENLMRRLISQFMIINIGSEWDKESLPKNVEKDLQKKTGDKQKDKDIKGILHKVDFIQLSNFLFEEYHTKNKDSDALFKHLKTIKSDSELHINDLKEFIPKSNWDRYFSPLVEDYQGSSLKTNWEELYKVRCLIAHNNLFDKHEYKKTLSLINEIQPILQKAIDNLNKISVPKEEQESILENVFNLSEFVQALNDVGNAFALKIQAIKPTLLALSSNINQMGNTLKPTLQILSNDINEEKWLPKIT